MKPFTLVLAAALALPAAAQDDMSDLFGDALKSDRDISDVKKQTKDLKARDPKQRGLTIKSNESDGEAKIEFSRVFAAAKIKLDRKEGCIPADKARTKLGYLAFSELPQKSDPFAICLTMKSKAGREIRVTTRIVDPRGRRVGVGNDVLDFRGKPVLHHILDFPELTFREQGQHFYVIELDGKEAAKLKLFNVKIMATGEVEYE